MFDFNSLIFVITTPSNIALNLVINLLMKLNLKMSIRWIRVVNPMVINGITNRIGTRISGLTHL